MFAPITTRAESVHDRSSIIDLFSHMEWADSTVWSVIRNLNLKDPDERLHQLLFHIHFTQHAFLQVWKGEEFRMRKVEEFEASEDIRTFAVEFYPSARALVGAANAADLDQPAIVPWAKYFSRRSGSAPEPTTLGETLMQVAMHTQYHRAQVNLRIRELGGEPPLVDYIAWLWLGRPMPVW